MAADEAALEDPVGAFVQRHGFVSDVPPGLPGNGRLAGLRFAVDDLVAIAGLVTGAGNPDWRRTHDPEPATAPAVRRLLSAGAALVGTTVVDELGFGTIGINALDGTPTNPVAPDSVPGGAASGGATAVAAGLADVALVGDTNGGARIPASVCGLYGLRPTHGRVPISGLVPRSPSFDTVGVLARDAASLWLTASVLLDAGPASDAGTPDRPITALVLAEDVWDVADDEVVDAMFPQLQRLAVRFPLLPLERLVDAPSSPQAWAAAQDLLVGHDTWTAHGAWFAATNPTTALDVKQRLDAARTATTDELARANAARDQACAALSAALGEDAALVLPTTPSIAPLLSDTDVELGDFRRRAAVLTCLAGLAGLPQVTVPFVQLAEYPIGLSLVGPAGSDERLLALAGTIGRPA